jgi:methylmalonyl-CoA mutase
VLQRQDNNHLIDQLCFRANIQTDFFLEIAKLKALRNLWYQVRGAYGALHEIKPLYIHGVSSRWVRDTYKPHGNMIKAATATMAAIAGGCDSVTVEPENPDNEMENRIARNVSSILREESHFSKVADPLTGSFYLEALTDQLSQKAWSKFQTLIHS